MKNSIYIHVPKTGGTTIEELFDLTVMHNAGEVAREFKGSGHVTFHHQFIPDLVLKKRLVPVEFIDNAFLYGTCRHPYDWAVSSWAFNVGWRPTLFGDCDTFLSFAKRMQDNIAVAHLWPQWTYYVGLKNRLDHIIRFENLEEDIRKVAKLLRKEVDEVPKVNASERGHWREYLCEESKCIIDDLYSEDFNRFKYKKEDL